MGNFAALCTALMLININQNGNKNPVVAVFVNHTQGKKILLWGFLRKPISNQNIYIPPRLRYIDDLFFYLEGLPWGGTWFYQFEFLDQMISLENWMFRTSTYFKKVYTNSYLAFDSGQMEGMEVEYFIWTISTDKKNCTDFTYTCQIPFHLSNSVRNLSPWLQMWDVPFRTFGTE